MANDENLPIKFSQFALKMESAGMSEATIRAFRHNYTRLVEGDSGLIRESEIAPVEHLPHLKDLPRRDAPDKTLLSQTVVLKLNGGLGTSMGLDRAKSLLPVRNGSTFLDFTVKQIQHLSAKHGVTVRFLLMNSFSTSRDTLEFLRQYPDLGDPAALELMQSQVPKVDARTLGPVSWPENPTLEWCPPGHGDIYPSLLGSGLLERLLREGMQYLFVSNSDNLGASLDLRLLAYFAASNQDFMMEVAERTLSDRKGGHLAKAGGRFLLRESAQCPAEDQTAFQDIQRHRFFNTNNLWIRLESIRTALETHQGFIPLPIIKNAKTVDPREKNSPPVIQLETAMGAAIQGFPNSGAVVVPRTRFAPVKTTSDLLALRSDAYTVTEDWRIVLANGGVAPPPSIDLDPEHYRIVEQLEQKLEHGVPSLKNCTSLKVRGPVCFSSNVVFRGNVTITAPQKTPHALPAGEYADCSVKL